jgi:hypothetical protein
MDGVMDGVMDAVGIAEGLEGRIRMTGRVDGNN